MLSFMGDFGWPYQSIKLPAEGRLRSFRFPEWPKGQICFALRAQFFQNTRA